MAIAEMNGIDLGTEIDRKLAKNEQRVYQLDGRGVPVRLNES